MISKLLPFPFYITVISFDAPEPFENIVGKGEIYVFVTRIFSFYHNVFYLMKDEFNVLCNILFAIWI